MKLDLAAVLLSLWLHSCNIGVGKIHIFFLVVKLAHVLVVGHVADAMSAATVLRLVAGAVLRHRSLSSSLATSIIVIILLSHLTLLHLPVALVAARSTLLFVLVEIVILPASSP